MVKSGCKNAKLFFAEPIVAEVISSPFLILLGQQIDHVGVGKRGSKPCTLARSARGPKRKKLCSGALNIRFRIIWWHHRQFSLKTDDNICNYCHNVKFDGWLSPAHY
jgi:hypothetical protein